MNKNFVLSAVCGLICAASLTACGSDPVSNDSAPETTTVTAVSETTAEDAAETTAADEKATTVAAETTAAETEADATTTEAEAEATTVEAVQTTEAPAAEPQQTEAPAQQEDPVSANPFEALKLGGDPSSFVAQNKNYSKTEADSCLVNGKDITYVYPDFELHTLLENGVETVKSIYVTGKSIRTPKGIGVGSTKADVTAAYGASISDFNTSYNCDGGILKFEFEGDVVSAIDMFKE